VKELLNKRVLVTTKNGHYAGVLVRVGKTHVCINKLLILNSEKRIIAAPKREKSRKFPIGNVVNVQLEVDPPKWAVPDSGGEL
jgi:small nuclear ribonucleoprotein (snRNP)-like protein